MKQLRKETQNRLEIATSSQREIAKWKRKNQIASDMAKKLERSNHFQVIFTFPKRPEVVAEKEE